MSLPLGENMGIPIIGPIAPYQNVPIAAQYYQPNWFTISNIQLGLTTQVTMNANIINGFTINPNYVIGQLIRLDIPPGNGCRQLNQVEGYVVAIPSQFDVVVNINSIGSDAFISNSNPNQSKIVAIGDINTGAINPNGLKNQSISIPGSFINISPL